MLLRNSVLLLLAIMVLASCSRLTFIRPKASVRQVNRDEPNRDLHDSEQTRQRMAQRERIALAAQRLRAGDLDVAEREAKSALKENPESADALTLLAIINDRRGRNDEAGAYYRRAAERAPRQGGPANNYGAWLCAHGYAAEALVWFDRALAAPGYGTPASALANAGGCALQTGQFERAGRDLQKALQLEPDNAYALESMARNKHRLGQDFEARAFVERRLAAAPATAGVLQLAADIEQGLGDKAAASRYLQRLRAEFPDSGAIHSGDSARQ